MSSQKFRVVVGSNNPVKINAIKSALALYYPNDEIECQGINAPSLVREQPMTTQETRDGAVNRLNYCQQHAQADFYAAIEGGVDNFEDGPATFAYIAISDGKQLSVGRSANLPLPQSVYQSLVEGAELGPLMDKLFSTHNIKQKGGAIGLLTNGLATREGNYRQAAVLALAKFFHASLFEQ
ncbi:inosine/xanthosine triphosphatase [Psychrobium sp. 1_MG-2023]|uniref:inosine/xanthosine triphosphatase n=1 Tax=Psychrobium sp. 1_MG-2023 TaxID=3062624 RepID=UPI000C32D503|nr:inosine/xanthosine triphosphatase [Psychrobium sp. 1_MG-2023]MDP2562742.1 inosine/xanthosine triphosphatase [Psychrobium sp. 1_MG-2023]PKF54259.1 non-canonical purine NTP phosphatase [Alteromonadales bacterium alter-6D02]